METLGEQTDNKARTVRSQKHNRTSSGCHLDNVKTETRQHSPQPRRKKMCLCGGKGELIAPECVQIPPRTSRSLFVFAYVESLLYTCVGDPNAFCYLPFSLKNRIHILASFLGSNDTLFVQTIQTFIPPFEFLTTPLTCLKYSTKWTFINVHNCFANHMKTYICKLSYNEM